MTAIKHTSGDVLNAEVGSLYPALHRMEETGWIRAEWAAKDTGRRTRFYQFTAAGKKQLDAEVTRCAPSAPPSTAFCRRLKHVVLVAHHLRLPRG